QDRVHAGHAVPILAVRYVDHVGDRRVRDVTEEDAVRYRHQDRLERPTVDGVPVVDEQLAILVLQGELGRAAGSLIEDGRRPPVQVDTRLETGVVRRDHVQT